MSLEITLADYWLWTQEELAEKRKETPELPNQIAVQFRSDEISNTVILSEAGAEKLLKALEARRAELRRAEIDWENLKKSRAVVAKRQAARKKTRKKPARKKK